MKFLYLLIQFTWGFFQTLFGLVVFLVHIRSPHYFYHGAIVTRWNLKSSVSLGCFIFVTNEPYFAEKLKDDFTKTELLSRLLVHEYGHTIQSLILGPFYLLAMGIPSTLWGFFPMAQAKRENGVSYFSFFTEKWANDLGEAVTHKKSMENLLID